MHHGLGSDKMDGQWHSFSRDLAADLDEAQTGVTITDVNSLVIKGRGFFDNVSLAP